MSYTPPAGDAILFDWAGAPPYTPPAGDAIVFAWDVSIDPVTGVGAAVVPITAAAVGSHGETVSGTGAAVVPVVAAAAGAHGIAGVGAAVVPLAAAAAGAHGAAGTGAAVVPIAAVAAAVHLRYEARGVVKLGGVLVNRRVRVYDRDTGELISQGDTVAGKFNLHTGFAEAECYALAIHMDPDAVDWRPPVANRVLTVLANDTA